MRFNNPIPRTGIPKFVEASSQQSPRESGTSGQAWKHSKKLSAQESHNTLAIGQIQRKIEKMRRRVVGAAYSITTVLQQCHIAGLYGGVTNATNSSNAADYFSVIRWRGNSTNGSNIGSVFYAAKSVPSRMSNSSNFYGEEMIITYTDDNNRVSNSNSDHTLETQVMTQPFSIRDVVYIASTDYSGVNAPNNGGDIKYIEVNTEREWTFQPLS
jgi:hypothetical protein